MELYLKKYFWVVPLVVVVVCATFAAMATNHLVEAKWLMGAGSKKATPRPPRAKPPEKAHPTASKDETAVISRNVFCGTAGPPCEVAPTVVTPNTPNTPAAPADPNHPPTTTLPLALLGTFVAHDPVFSSATLVNTQLNKQGSYWMHEAIPGAGDIRQIQPRYVDFFNSAAGRVERVDLMGVPPPVAAATPATPPPVVASTGGDGDMTAEFQKGIKKIDETHYEIDRSVVDKVLASPDVIARSARIVPSIKDGKANGFKMYAIRPNSVYAMIGFQNGDTINAINGFEITSPDKALEIYTKVKSATSLSVDVTRRGSGVTLQYSIK